MRVRRPASPDDPVTEFASLATFVHSDIVPSGRFAIGNGGAPVDFLYSPAKHAGTTVVVLHGSTKRDVTLPMLSGKGIMRGVRANHLAISDPSLTLDGSQQLILSWYAGSSRQPLLQDFLRRSIDAITKRTATSHLIFLGGSGGGFASLELARHFPGSLALVMNPQIALSRYHHHLVRNYLDLCWDGAPSLDYLPAHIAYDLVAAYPRRLSHTIAYMQNTRDDHHIANHQLPFFEKVGLDPNLFMLMGAWGEPTSKGHVRPPSDLTKSVLERLVESYGRWDVALDELGFDRRTTAEAVEATVRRENAGLPEKLVTDTM